MAIQNNTNDGIFSRNIHRPSTPSSRTPPYYPLVGMTQNQATADVPDLLARVKQLTEHEKFTLKNPNRLRSVISSFASCQSKFHAKDGSGYEFLGDMVLEVDQLNPQV